MGEEIGERKASSSWGGGRRWRGLIRQAIWAEIIGARLPCPFVPSLPARDVALRAIKVSPSTGPPVRLRAAEAKQGSKLQRLFSVVSSVHHDSELLKVYKIRAVILLSRFRQTLRVWGPGPSRQTKYNQRFLCSLQWLVANRASRPAVVPMLAAIDCLPVLSCLRVLNSATGWMPFADH